MKSSIDAILQTRQAEYLDSLLPPRDALLESVENYAAKHAQPIADPEVAQLMRIVLGLLRPKRLLEIGTNIGYSVIVMGREVAPDAVIETIELDESTLDIAREFVSRASLQCQVIYHCGAALEALPALEGPWDFTFIDCVKTEYLDYLDAIVPKMSRGGVIFCDNLLWKGQVADGGTDSATTALRRFNARISSDERLSTVILPVGDGVGVSIVRGSERLDH